MSGGAVSSRSSVRSTRAQRALVVLLASTALACSEPVDESTATAQHAVIRGEVSDAADDSVVLIWNDRPAGGTWCTGALVAPRLVLTARHCLFQWNGDAEEKWLYCDERGATSPVLTSYDPAQLSVSVGSEQGPGLDVVAVGVDVHSSPALDLCQNDVALLELDTPIDREVYPLRLAAPPLVGERGVLVGWGLTEQELGTAGNVLTDGRRRRDIEILAIGETTFRPPGGSPRFIERATFVGTEGGCRGDSGGPLISTETGAIFGIMHATQRPDPSAAEIGGPVELCLDGYTAFNRVDLQASWIRRAFERTGAAPWLEGRPKPGEFGVACELADDCVSGLCVQAGASAFCSAPCDAEECPSGGECVGPERDRVCVLPQVDSAERASGGCRIDAPRAGNHGSSAGGVMLAAVVVLAARGWRRRALPRR